MIFLGTVVVTDVQGFLDPVVSRGRAPTTGPEGSPWIAVVLSFPVAMALATGTEAPATAMAQLGQLGLADRRRFARTTIMLTLLIVAALTLGLSESLCVSTSGSRSTTRPRSPTSRTPPLARAPLTRSSRRRARCSCSLRLREGRRGLVAVNAIGALSVAFTLVVNLGRGYPLLSLAATALIAFGLYALWRPTGVEELERIGESDE